MALESQNIPAYPWYFETFDAERKVSIQAHQKSQLNVKNYSQTGNRTRAAWVKARNPNP